MRSDRPPSAIRQHASNSSRLPDIFELGHHVTIIQGYQDPFGDVHIRIYRDSHPLYVNTTISPPPKNTWDISGANPPLCGGTSGLLMVLRIKCPNNKEKKEKKQVGEITTGTGADPMGWPGPPCGVGVCV